MQWQQPVKMPSMTPAPNDYLGRKVRVNGDEKKGTLQIEFYGQEDLSELIRKLNLNQ